MTAPAAVAPPRTEREVLDLLLEKYGIHHGNGRRYTVAEHVRSHAGFQARRTADFVAMDLWPSKGLALHGHEVKVSRSDWLTELKQPEKAAEFTPYMDYWWLVVSDRKIVKEGELPEGWGLMAPRGGALAVVFQALRRAEPKPLTRSRMAAFIRAVEKTAAATESRQPLTADHIKGRMIRACGWKFEPWADRTPEGEARNDLAYRRTVAMNSLIEVLKTHPNPESLIPSKEQL